MSNRRPKKKKDAAAHEAKVIPAQPKIFFNLLKTTQQFLQGKSYQPMSVGDLIRKLHLQEQHETIFNEVIAALIADNTIEIKRGLCHCNKPAAPAAESIIGILRLHPRGFGFVKPENTTKYAQDIFIPKHLTENGVDGDTVEVAVNTEVISDKGPEGKVITILQRARTHLGGIIRQEGRDGTFYAYAPLLGLGQRIIVEVDKKNKVIVGDRVVMEIIEWGNKDSPTLAKVARMLGHISDASCDNDAAIHEYELRHDFPSKVAEEAKSFGNSVPQSEIKKREDLRSLTCVTIDPDTAKDFDDAISLTKDSKGHYHLGVHIADVSHYVHPESFLDLEAQMRCNSTYFPGFCLPMLPRELSDNLCSLKPNVNRLAASVLMEFDPSGTLVNYRMTRSVIKSAKRFTYKEAKAVLDGKKSSQHLDLLRLMVELCGHLKKKRYERGSVEFGLPELVVLVNDKGVPTGTDYVVYDITHQMVEEFMLKANETVAWHISELGKNLTYRVHDVPSEENLKDFALLAGAFGFHLSPTPTPKEIQKLFDEAMGSPYGEYLATSYIRRMRLAVYSSDNIGHYGLSLLHYCHFTSPIRRYVDLVAHRILFHLAEEKEKLEMIASRCSDQERISAKAENSVVLLKKLRLLEARNKEQPNREYDAVVTRVKNFGIYFEVVELMLEGYFHVSELENDYYVYDDAEVILKGRNSGQVYRAGDKIFVRLKEVDLITLECRWDLFGNVQHDHELESKRRRIKAKQSKGNKRPPSAKPTKERRPLRTSKKKPASKRKKK